MLTNFQQILNKIIYKLQSAATVCIDKRVFATYFEMIDFIDYAEARNICFARPTKRKLFFCKADSVIASSAGSTFAGRAVINQTRRGVG